MLIHPALDLKILQLRFHQIQNNIRLWKLIQVGLNRRLLNPDLHPDDLLQVEIVIGDLQLLTGIKRLFIARSNINIRVGFQVVQDDGQLSPQLIEDFVLILQDFIVVEHVLLFEFTFFLLKLLDEEFIVPEGLFVVVLGFVVLNDPFIDDFHCRFVSKVLEDLLAFG